MSERLTVEELYKTMRKYAPKGAYVHLRPFTEDDGETYSFCLEFWPMEPKELPDDRYRLPVPGTITGEQLNKILEESK